MVVGGCWLSVVLVVVVGCVFCWLLVDPEASGDRWLLVVCGCCVYSCVSVLLHCIVFFYFSFIVVSPFLLFCLFVCVVSF